jgi:hypothetical protein
MRADATLAALVLTAAAAAAQPIQPVPTETFPVSDALATAPQATISNGRITARIALPDPVDGFYRGTRFDQAGVVTSLTLNGREFYGPWFERTAPDVLDYAYVPEGIAAGPDSATSGPVEEFAPLGFKPEAGTHFVKIGVGLLLQPDDQPYDHYRHYEIVDTGTRRNIATPDHVTFLQTLAGNYEYEKTLRLAGSQLIIEHRLKNLGAAAISTTVYDHNFLRLVPGNAGVKVTFPFSVKAATRPPSDLIAIDGKSLTYLRSQKDRERISFPITGFGPKPSDYAFTVMADKAGVSVTGDQPLTKVNIFSIDRTMAVEPYIAINLAPGAEMKWKYVYSYTAP